MGPRRGKLRRSRFAWRKSRPMTAFRFAAIGLLVVVASAFGWRAPSTTAPTSKSVKHLGHFSIAGREYTIDLETKKIQPGSAGAQGDTVVAMEIKDSEGAVQSRRTVPYMEAKEDYFEAWSVSAFLLGGYNGQVLLLSYFSYSQSSE